MKKQWLLLAPGFVFLYFSNGRFSTPAAAWLFPLFLLLVSRNPATRFSAILFPLLVGITLQASFWKFTNSDFGNILFCVPFFAGLLFGFVFYADRWFVKKSDSFSGTLFFPLLYTSVDFINSLVNPFGTTGVLGYSQLGFLPFAQLAAFTGMWGLTFMITWFGSVATWALNKSFSQTAKGLLTYSSFFIAIMIFGVIRLSLPLKGVTVKVAGIHTTDKERDGKVFWKALAQKDTGSFNKASKEQIQNLASATSKQANQGAKIILWSEVSPTILKSHETTLETQLKTLAKQLNIYLITNPYVATTDGTQPENKIWIFSPTGDLIFIHYKYGGNFIEGSVEGDKRLKSVTTPYGNISGIICWDADFPAVARQLGKQETDIVFNPASDWKEIDPLHTRVAVFRAIENGCSWVRQTRNGLSVITDPRGKIISQMDHFETDKWINSGNVPTKKIGTLYPVIGDLFGWLAISGLLVLLFLKIGKGQKYA
jgi:apolipoprotein N-acyltransferase